MKAFIIYCVVAIIATFPLITHLGSNLVGNPLDAYNYIWNIDEFWTNVLSGNNPFYSTRIFFPVGSSLAFHTFAPFLSLFALPFINNLVVYINLVVILSFSLSALTMNLLVLHLTKNKYSAFVSGFVYGFAPIMVSYIISQHYYFAFASVFLPLGILLLYKYFEEHKRKYLFLYSAAFLSVFLTDYYLTILSAILLAFVVLFNTKRIRKNFYITLSASILIPISFFILSIFGTEGIKSRLYSNNNYPQICSAEVSKFLLPSEHNIFLGELTVEYKNANSIPYNFDTPSYYLGFSLLALSIYWTWKYRKNKEVIVFATIGMAIFLFSLGPKTPIFVLFSKLPFMSLIDCPQRFPVGTQLAMATILGIGLHEKIKTVSPRKKFFFVLYFLVLIAVEYSFSNLPFEKVEVPSVYKILSKDKANKTILELPSGISESKGAFGYDWSIQGLHVKQLYWQTIHKKPRVGGYLSRLSPEIYMFYKTEPIISDLFTLSSLNGQWTKNTFTEEEVSSFIDKFNLGYVVLSPNNRQVEFENIVEEIFGRHIKEKYSYQEYILYYIN